MKELTCIVCPVGCLLEIDESSAEFAVTGNRCSRGAVYAQEEMRAPKRTVTATCPIDGREAAGAERRVPVKSASPCPREKIPALLEDIYKMKVRLPVKAGDVVLADWKGEGIDIVATRTFN